MDNFLLIKTIQPFVHYGLHFVFPVVLAYVFFRKNWKKAWLIMIATMLVDLDHLFSTPIFDPSRCSIGHHLLHTYPFIFIYFILLFIPKTRVVAVGLLFHMFTDFIDCSFMFHL